MNALSVLRCVLFRRGMIVVAMLLFGSVPRFSAVPFQLLQGDIGLRDLDHVVVEPDIRRQSEGEGQCQDDRRSEEDVFPGGLEFDVHEV